MPFVPDISALKDGAFRHNSGKLVGRVIEKLSNLVVSLVVRAIF